MERNSALFDKIAAAIEETPARWRQENFVSSTYSPQGDICDTAFCLAGWALNLSGLSPGEILSLDGPSIKAAKLLGLNFYESDRLFYQGFSYAKENKDNPGEIAEALRAIGRGVSVDDALPRDWTTE
jgi:hypothetical protein